MSTKSKFLEGVAMKAMRVAMLAGDPDHSHLYDGNHLSEETLGLLYRHLDGGRRIQVSSVRGATWTTLALSEAMDELVDSFVERLDQATVEEWAKLHLQGMLLEIGREEWCNMPEQVITDYRSAAAQARREAMEREDD